MDEYRKEMQLKQAKKRSQRKRSNVKGSFTQVLLVIGCGIMCVISGLFYAHLMLLARELYLLLCKTVLYVFLVYFAVGF
jgi:hypothetical protein